MEQTVARDLLLASGAPMEDYESTYLNTTNFSPMHVTLVSGNEITTGGNDPHPCEAEAARVYNASRYKSRLGGSFIWLHSLVELALQSLVWDLKCTV